MLGITFLYGFIHLQYNRSNFTTFEYWATKNTKISYKRSETLNYFDKQRTIFNIRYNEILAEGRVHTLYSYRYKIKEDLAGDNM